MDMTTNMAVKRAKKAQRRKQVVAQKRRAEAVEASLPARVLRAAQTPIRHCFLTEAVFEIGMGTLVLTRGGTQDHLTLSSFLIDTFCLGIKDVMFQPIERDAFEMYMERMDAGSPMAAVDPGYARKLLRDLAVWSQSIGFAPHRDFTVVESVFGERGCVRRGLSVRSRRQAFLYSGPERHRSPHSAADRATAEPSRRRRFWFRDGGLRLVLCSCQYDGAPRRTIRQIAK
jgi:hypothetical protein